MKPIRKLADNEYLNQSEKSGKLNAACVKGDTELIRSLINDKDYDPNWHGGVAMRVSAYHGKLESCHELLKLGCNEPADLCVVLRRNFFVWDQRISWSNK